MEWEEPGIVADVRPYGEGDAIASVMTETHGVHRGLARGGAAKARAATWQPGNILQLRWIGRVPEQLGVFTGELVHPTAALVLDAPLPLALLSSACAVADGALPEREPHPPVFGGLLRLLAGLGGAAPPVADYIRWEATLLAGLGYGLDLAACAVTGATSGLCYVSPKTGRAVSDAGAGSWRERLLPLPPFLLGATGGTPAEWLQGLRLTGHFLARDAFGHYHRPLPASRLMLEDRVAALAGAKPEEPIA
ncbi:MAG: DNA repair protein RecO [Acetobacteraceae bacterium]|nr:DNA repair protein RecO [Acetobacteraceae bacterium]